MICTFSFLANLTPLYTHSQTGRWCIYGRRNTDVYCLTLTLGFLCLPVTQNAEDCPGIKYEEFPPWPTGMSQDITLHLSNVEQVVSLVFI